MGQKGKDEIPVEGALEAQAKPIEPAPQRQIAVSQPKQNLAGIIQNYLQEATPGNPSQIRGLKGLQESLFEVYRKMLTDFYETVGDVPFDIPPQSIGTIKAQPGLPVMEIFYCFDAGTKDLELRACNETSGALYFRLVRNGNGEVYIQREESGPFSNPLTEFFKFQGQSSNKLPLSVVAAKLAAQGNRPEFLYNFVSGFPALILGYVARTQENVAKTLTKSLMLGDSSLPYTQQSENNPK